MFFLKKPLPRRTDSPTLHKKIAGHVFGLENRHPEVENTCRKYICDQQPEAVFSVSQHRTDALQLGRSDGENESTTLQENIPKR